MEIQITARPNLLLETVELMYAYVNQIPAEKLVAPGEFCLPVEAVEEMLRVVCADVPRNDPMISYFFSRFPLLEKPNQYTCIARNLAYNYIGLSGETLEEDYAHLRDFRRIQLRNHGRFDGITEFRLTEAGSELEESGFVPLALDILQLNIEQEYAVMLVEQFSNYDAALERLSSLIDPAAKKLAPLLAPWVSRADPLARTWQEHMEKADTLPRLLQRIRFQEEPDSIIAVHAQLRYLLPKNAPGLMLVQPKIMYFHLGTAVPVNKREAETFESWEFEALRLLGNETRMRMLRLMMDKPRSVRELTRLLNLHLGTAYRDITSMYANNLLTIEVINSRKKYSVNTDTLSVLTKHILQLNKYEAL